MHLFWYLKIAFNITLFLNFIIDNYIKKLLHCSFLPGKQEIGRHVSLHKL